MVKFYTERLDKFIAVLFCAVFLFLGLVRQASATIYYVDSSVDDANVASATPDCVNYDPTAYACGSGSDSVYKTIADVNAKAFSAGDQILFKKGDTWAERILLSDNGTAGNEIIFGAFGSGDNPIITGGDGQAAIYARAYLNGGSYTIIQDIDIVANQNGIDIATWDNITIRRCRIYNCAANGVVFTAESGDYSDDVVIEDTDIYDNAAYGVFSTFGGDSTISRVNAYNNSTGEADTSNQLSASPYGGTLTIEDCSVYGTGGGNGIGTSVGTTDSTTIIQRCNVYDNVQAGIIAHGSDAGTVLMRYNLVYGNGDYGITVGTNGNINTEMYNNTIYNNDGWGLLNQSAGSHIVKNNIIYSNGELAPDTGGQISWYQTGSTLVADFNVITEQSQNRTIYIRKDSAMKTIAQWQAYESNSFDQNSVSSDPLFEDADNDNFILQSLSPAVDAGTDVSLTSDYAGNSIYGTPDIGAYEYQPPYTMGTNLINTTGSLRLYTDGKHRYTAATSTAPTADFTITPVNGSFYADYEEYMDITIDSWLTTGTYNKQWTATSSIATTTVYTINNLDTDTYYQFKIDGTASSTAITDDACNSNGSCLSDANGSITFTYTGGYSTHTFSLEKDVTEPGSFELSSPADGSLTGNRQPVLSWNAASDSESGISYYQLYLDGVLNVDNISGTSASLTNLSDGSHTWYVKAVDNNGNVTGSSSFNLSFGGGSGGLPSVAWLPPIIPSGGFQVSAKPAGKTVALEFSAGTDIARMAISDNPDFSGASQIPYQPSYDWEYPEGTQTVYIKFFNQWGQPTETITQAIGTQATPKLIRYPNDFKVYLIKDGKKFWIKDEQTFNSLNYNWNDVVQTTQDYPDGEAVSTAEPTVTLFSVDLTRGTVSDDVRRLQQLLSTQSDIYPEGLVTGYFGSLTESAVQRFQLKYGVVASPAEPGYGRVGPKTRKKLGEVF